MEESCLVEIGGEVHHVDEAEEQEEGDDKEDIRVPYEELDQDEKEGGPEHHARHGHACGTQLALSPTCL